MQKERERLQVLLADLAGDGLVESRRVGTAELSSLDRHESDIGSETFERTKKLSIQETLQRDLAAVEDALAKVERGDYGRCEACGRKIDPARLAARPAARFCIDDQGRVEREARASAEAK